jgi:hypothetical protein
VLSTVHNAVVGFQRAGILGSLVGALLNPDPSAVELSIVSTLCISVNCLLLGALLQYIYYDR